MAQSRQALQQEILRLDEQINQIVAQMPQPKQLQVIPFPWFLWLLAIIGIGHFMMPDLAGGYVPKLKEYAVAILIAGCICGVLALFNTFRSVFYRSGKPSGEYRKMSEQVARLQKQRALLQMRMREIEG
jgi:hypothetical protein